MRGMMTAHQLLLLLTLIPSNPNGKCLIWSKSATTTMKGNKPDQSNQPPHRTIWKPPPRPILKVNSDDAIFRKQNSVDVVLDMGGGLVLFWIWEVD